jgi:hypothetical protein
MITVSCRTPVIFIRKTDAPEFNRVMPLTGYHPQN